MQRSWPILAVSLLAALCAEPAFPFCGFYVAKADTKLFNQASQVAIVRDGDRTVMTMANDFQGDPTEFAMVIPVPTLVKREQIAVADKALLDHLDAYSSPRLVEYHDPNPCARSEYDGLKSLGYLGDRQAPMAAKEGRDRSLGVTIEARYTVGEYDILILSAKQSGGLDDLAARERLPHPAWRLGGAGQLHPPADALLRRAREPEGAGAAGLHLPAAAADRVRVAEVHAAHPPGHRERERPAGAVRVRDHAGGPRRGHELPHGPPAQRRRRAGLRQGRVRCRSTSRCSPSRSAARTCASSSRNTPGTCPRAIPARPTRCRPTS